MQHGGLVRVCFALAPAGDLPLSGMIDTDHDGRCDAGVGPECVIAAGTIEIDGTVVTTGARPLVLIAATTIQIGRTGVLDAASYSGRPAPPAGHDPTGCAPGTGSSSTSVGMGTSSGGGAGGSLRHGRRSGRPDEDGRRWVGGTRRAVPVVVTGGCAGGSGGAANPTAGGCLGGSGGGGGGAVYLIAGTEIVVDGTVEAYGAGGA